ncbi:MAG: GFA family protein [Pseudomonadales bacterium]|jgi:hypothetical protein
MIRGSCLCGRVRFEVTRITGPFELCHCPRCRKVSGSAFMSGVGAEARDFRFVSGVEEVERFELPVRERPPPYGVSFCRRCGSPLPNPPDEGFFEIPAGLLDDDPGCEPDKHIYVEHVAPWWRLDDRLPRFTRSEIAAYRAGESPDA